MSSSDPSPSPSDSPQEPAPKLVVDSDWKEQVEREKSEALEKERQQDAENTPAEAAPEESVPDAPAVESSSPPMPAGGEAESAQELPPPGMEYLLSMLMSQAMAYMGAVPELTGEGFEVNKPLAKHAIDTVEVLEQKTKGNLSEHEAKMMGEVLHVLRMTYVNTR